ncbi:hypothetical protein THTE_1209 [Thermogutta terrifontis]|uniref:Uncharacterized protein n=1 Tax=Thermogutta terrifontis TaxID=1331910 RepID=A0A286RCY0_9BACT|nr:hypothetical protein THTE_1209 [Thermogutta terrifontis]
MSDHPFLFPGHDKRAPPISFLLEGCACRVRRSGFDRPFRLRGHDKRAPPIRR